MKIRAHLFPTVIYNQTFANMTMQEAAREMAKQFDGNQVNFGKAVFADLVSNNLTVTPLDADGHAIDRKAVKFSLDEVGNQDASIQNDHVSLYRVSMYPTVRYLKEFEVGSKEEAAVMMLQEFNGHAVDFGEGSFDDHLADLLIVDPIDDSGGVIYSQSRQMSLCEVDALISDMAESQDDNQEESAPAM